MSDEITEVQHREPVWRQRSDFVIAAEIEPNEYLTTEQLFCRQVADHRFELCCIPFYLYDMALGDIVETDETYMVKRVVQPSGRYVFRIWLGDTGTDPDEVSRELTGLGAIFEWYSPRLAAVDARDLTHAQTVSDHLEEAETAGRYVYETGRR